jgi:hypothetical protein
VVAQIYLTLRRFNVFEAICPTRYSQRCNRGTGKGTSASWRTHGEVDRAMENSSEGFLAVIATSLKRRAILNRYRRVVKRQRADEAKISSSHIRHYGLKAKPRLAPDM